MKRISKCFSALFLILIICSFLYKVTEVSSKTNMVVTQTSDKLLGNFIGSAYNIFYGREADLDGFTYWYNMLSKGMSSAKTFIEKFVLESNEFLESVKLKEEFISKIYRFIFGRDTDKQGKQYWSNYIDQRILYYYKDEYPLTYKDNEILTLRWNINDSPKVISDVMNKLIFSDEFAIRVSLMNIKLDEGNINIPKNRTSALSIYNSLENDIKVLDYTDEIERRKQEALKLEKNLINSLGSSKLKNKILTYLGDRVDNVGVTFYDITTKESFSINGDVLFKAGSTHKVPLNIVLYDLVQAGKIDLNSRVEYIHSKHYESGSGILQNYVVNEYLSPQTFSELSKRSLLNSDNIAANMLISGISEVTSLYREYGKILGAPLDRTGNLFSTNDMTKFLFKLYENKDNNPYYKNIIQYLKDSSTGVRIGRYIPEAIVANKYGSFQGNYHDMGIVFGDRPFILAIYTKDLSNAEKVIADIAKIVYER
ncbi:serine hydrolase [Candidatus Arthromitus sp. SFB-rat-Yit]|uniref:serine hydrolase n=1 Tax=Candidatus Arthromitus sp. SFB-rat-Yit TaxID=1041504 RepID=UPI000227A321|nr:serine hydrolase [Candidatus Arthromitus sp. SFB-rat-Yit]BAK81467.1 putative beta-lactamase class A-like protein [Candidatus Arthromitus sp. SFB-rat-Yit]